MKRRLWAATTVLAVVIGGWAYYYRGSVAANAPAILTAEATRGSVVETVEATGTLEAVTTVQVGTQVSGTIKTLYADFNSKVRRGQVIAELDPSLFQTQVEQARATVARLQAEAARARVQVADTQMKLRRANELFDKLLIPASDLETAESNAKTAEAALQAAEAQVVQARASLNQSQVNLGHTIIRAPIDGVVVARNVDVGQTVAASMQAPTLFIIARDLSDMRVNASIDESDIGRIEPGQPAQFRVDAYPERTFTGTVSQVRLQPVVQQNVVSYITVIDVPNDDLKLKPGMTATVTIEIARDDDVVRVPNAALRFRPAEDVLPANNGEARSEAGRGSRQPHVWVLENGALRRVPVRLGVSDGTQTAIVAGDLSAGALVATGVAARSAATTPAAGSPLLPQRLGRGAAGGRR